MKDELGSSLMVWFSAVWAWIRKILPFTDETENTIGTFLLMVLIIAPILYVTRGENDFAAPFYYMAKAALGFGLADTLWKYLFRNLRNLGGLKSAEVLGIYILRGMVYGSIIMSVTMGL